MSDVDIIKILLDHKELGVAVPVLALAVTYGNRIIKIAEKLGILKKPCVITEIEIDGKNEKERSGILWTTTIVYAPVTPKLVGNTVDSVAQELLSMVADARESQDVNGITLNLSRVVGINDNAFQGFNVVLKRTIEEDNIKVRMIFPEKEQDGWALVDLLMEELKKEMEHLNKKTSFSIRRSFSKYT